MEKVAPAAESWHAHLQSLRTQRLLKVQSARHKVAARRVQAEVQFQQEVDLSRRLARQQKDLAVEVAGARTDMLTRSLRRTELQRESERLGGVVTQAEAAAVRSALAKHSTAIQELETSLQETSQAVSQLFSEEGAARAPAPPPEAGADAPVFPPVGPGFHPDPRTASDALHVPHTTSRPPLGAASSIASSFTSDVPLSTSGVSAAAPAPSHVPGHSLPSARHSSPPPPNSSRMPQQTTAPSQSQSTAGSGAASVASSHSRGSVSFAGERLPPAHTPTPRASSTPPQGQSTAQDSTLALPGPSPSPGPGTARSGQASPPATPLQVAGDAFTHEPQPSQTSSLPDPPPSPAPTPGSEAPPGPVQPATGVAEPTPATPLAGVAGDVLAGSPSEAGGQGRDVADAEDRASVASSAGGSISEVLGFSSSFGGFGTSSALARGAASRSRPASTTATPSQAPTSTTTTPAAFALGGQELVFSSMGRRRGGGQTAQTPQAPAPAPAPTPAASNTQVIDLGADDEFIDEDY